MSQILVNQPDRTSEMKLSMNGIDATVSLRHTPNYVHASVFIDMPGTDFELSIPEVSWQGFCDIEIAYEMLCQHLSSRNGIESPDIWNELTETYGECECDD